MYHKLSKSLRGVFGTNAFADGSATNADSTPTCVVLQNGTAMGYAPTVTNKAVGLYEVVVDVTSGNGFAVGDVCSVYVVVTVGAKVTRAPVHGISSFNVTARDPDDLAYPATTGRSLAVDTSGQVTVGGYAAGQAPLQPTVSGRTLLVDASGDVTVGAYGASAVPGGQLKPNSVIDLYTYGIVGKPTSWRVRVFASKAAADSAYATPGHADNADGEVERYKGSATYNPDGTLAAYKIPRDL